MTPKPFTFNFRGRNSRDEFGLLATSYDFLLPEKRARKQAIPFRSGTYDHGARYYNERTLRLRCIWISDVVKSKSRADIREISYWLASKGQLTLAVEPDKYYIGELYEPTELVARYNYASEARTTDGEFELNFTCEPFAYRYSDALPIGTGVNKLDYPGTAETPCTIILKNTTGATVSNVQVVATRRKI